MEGNESLPTEQTQKASAIHEEEKTGQGLTALKLDPQGFPLRPQPSDDPLGAAPVLANEL